MVDTFVVCSYEDTRLVLRPFLIFQCYAQKKGEVWKSGMAWGQSYKDILLYLRVYVFPHDCTVYTGHGTESWRQDKSLPKEGYLCRGPHPGWIKGGELQLISSNYYQELDIELL